jgi:subtilase family serine protease/RNA polymerase subunit RPABC4/transcription elongation factor Spt4
LVFSSVLTISITDDATAPSPPYIDGNGNMIVTGGKTVLIENYITNPFKHSGDIIINQSSTLIIRNSTFKINPDTNHAYTVTITENSKMVVDNSTFTVDTNTIQATYFVRFDIYQGSIEIRDSSMILPGTFNVTDSDFTAVNSKFSQLNIGYGSPIQIFNASNVYYEDCSVKDFKVNVPMKLLEDTEFVAINTFFDLDYDSKQIQVANSSHAYLYGVTVNPGLYKYRPINVIHDQCYVNIYRWLEVSAVDMLDIPLENTKVEVKNITDHTVPTPESYILTYLGKTSMNYQYTNKSGLVILPLMSDNLTYDSMPNSISMGNYKLTGYKGTAVAKTNTGLPGYPVLTAISNIPNATLVFNEISSPKTNKYYSSTFSDIIITDNTGSIKNSLFQRPQGGVVDLSYGQQGNIIVNGTGVGGQLDLVGTKLGIEQDDDNKYYVLIEENGRINFKTKSGIMDGPVTPGIYPINVYMRDSGKMTLTNNCNLSNIGSFGMEDDTELTLVNSALDGGRLYANGNGASTNLMIATSSNSRINVSSLSLKNSNINLENTNVTLKQKPVLENLNFNAKNTSFDQKLVFKAGSMAELYNVTTPGFFTHISAMDTSNIKVYWYLTVVVKDQQGNPLMDAKVRIYNYTINSGNLEPIIYKSGFTNKYGEFTYPVLGAEITKSGHFFGGLIGNYYVNATYFGTESDVGASTRSGSRGSGVDVFGQNQDVEIVIPGTPDVTVGTISQSPSPTEKNQETTIKVPVRNIGNFTAFNIDVEIWDTDIGIMIHEETIPYIGPGNTSMVSVKRTYASEGIYTIRARVDPSNNIDELDEKNNEAFHEIEIISRDKADLAVVPGSLITTPGSPISLNSKVIIQATIKNNGTLEAKDFIVQFYTNEIKLGNEIIILSLKPNETKLIKSSIWLIDEVGEFIVKVSMDIYNDINETNEDNNNATRTVETVIGPDLTISKISFNPKPPITREDDFLINIEIANVGPSNISKFYVGLYLDSTATPLLNEYIYVPTELNPDGGSTEIQYLINKEMAKAKFSIPKVYRIFVIVDPDDLISETDEDNNTKLVDLTIKRKADLTLTSDDITFSEEQADNGIDLTITARISNIGETTSEGYIIRFFDDNIQINPDKTVNEGLAPNTAKPLTQKWNSTRGGNHKIRVQIISDTTDEENKNNNIATNVIYVKTKPDLFVTEEDITTNKENEQILEDETVVIYYTIHNGGNTTAEDVNYQIWDGAPNEPGSTLMKTSFFLFLFANSDGEGFVSYEFKSAGLHHIWIVIDPDNKIDEKYKENNTGHRDIYITRTAPDLTILAENFDFTPYVRRDDGTGKKIAQRSSIIIGSGDNAENFWFNISITNNGTERADNIKVALYADDEDTLLGEFNIDELNYEIGNNTAYNDTELIKAKYNKDFTGFHKIIAVIDPDKTVSESDETNNRFEFEQGYKIIKAGLEVKRIEVQNSDGDYIYDGELNPMDPKKDEVMYIYAYVINTGNVPANVFVKFYLDEVMATQTSMLEIEPNGEGAFTYQTIYDDSGSIDIEVEAFGDFGGENESVSVASPKGDAFIPVEVIPDTEDEEDNFLLILIIIIVVIVVVVLVVVFFLLKRKRAKMAECSECGALIALDATECPKCGAEFSDEIECGECGALMKVTDTVCPECGAVFAKEGEEGEGGEGESPGPGDAPSVDSLKAQVRATPTPPKPGAAPPGKPKGAPPASVKPTPGPAPKAAGPSPAPKPAPEPAPKPEAQDMEEEVEEEKAECYRCGAIVPLSASMCPECGAEFE